RRRWLRNRRGGGNPHRGHEAAAVCRTPGPRTPAIESHEADGYRARARLLADAGLTPAPPRWTTAVGRDPARGIDGRHRRPARASRPERPRRRQLRATPTRAMP